MCANRLRVTGRDLQDAGELKESGARCCDGGAGLTARSLVARPATIKSCNQLHHIVARQPRPKADHILQDKVSATTTRRDAPAKQQMALFKLLGQKLYGWEPTAKEWHVIDIQHMADGEIAVSAGRNT